MIETITDEELELMECLYDPVCLSECLFSDMDCLDRFDERFSHIRNGQLPLLSYEYCLDYDSSLTKKQNFKLKEGSGNIWCFAGRGWGKTMVVEKIDSLVGMFLSDGESVGFTSYDASHISGVLEYIAQAVEKHPLYQMFEPRIKRSPWLIELNNGYRLEGVNMNLTGKSPGKQFFQKHFHKLYIEENSFENEEIFIQRRDSQSEIGIITRSAGMTNFVKHSVAGKIFYDILKKNWMLNISSYVSPMWDENEKEKAIREFGGESSLGFKIYVKGEVTEDGISVIDMQRARKCYLNDRIIKHLEISKENHNQYESILIIERPNNAEQIFLAADIGEAAPTKITIFSKVNEKYKYIYKISLYGLTDKEQYNIFKYISERINVNFLGCDCGDGTGRSLYRRLEEIFNKQNLFWYAGAMKIRVGFEKDENDNVIFKDGSPVYKEEYMSEWSIKRIKDLFYEQEVICPLDYELDEQLNKIIQMQSGSRIVYECIAKSNHLLDSFRVFSCMEWDKKFSLVSPISKKQFCKTGFW